MVAGEPVDPLNIAEGNGKTADANRRRYFEIARGSALECAAIADVLVVGKALDKTESQSRKMELDRMAAMLSRLGGRGYQVREDRTIHGDERNDFDPDFDSDLDEDAKEPQPSGALCPSLLCSAGPNADKSLLFQCRTAMKNGRASGPAGNAESFSASLDSRNNPHGHHWMSAAILCETTGVSIRCP